jgi:thiamine-monophosphate kinase
MRLFEAGEAGFLNAIRRFTDMHPLVETGFGDDAAILKCVGAGGRMAVTTDLLVEGTHFSLALCTPFELGIKAYEVNASDLAAVGALPVAAFLSIGVLPDTPLALLMDFYKGFRRAARRHKCVIAGGDTVRAETLLISVMLIGRYMKGAMPLLRSGAKPGHRVYVTGWPGESGMGFKLLRKYPHQGRIKRWIQLIKRHVLPEARVVEGLALARSRHTGAAIDVSDGVLSELRHISRMSHVRLNIPYLQLPVSSALDKASRELGVNPRDMVLFGGEDYELLFTSSLNKAGITNLFHRAGSRIAVHEIGRVEKGRGVRILDERGEALSFTDRTFQHFTPRKKVK